LLGLATFVLLIVLVEVGMSKGEYLF
jgi:hypothetical protein